MIGEGMKVRFVPDFTDSSKYTPQERRQHEVTAKIVYINWEHRYFTVEWVSEGRTLRESFKFAYIGKVVSVIG